MLVTWGQSGIPFAGNVALSQTRLSDEKVLLDWNHKPVFETTTGMLRYDNDSLGNVSNGQFINDEIAGSQWRCYNVGTYTTVINDGKNQCLKNTPSRTDMYVIHAGGTPIYSNQGWGVRALFKIDSPMPPGADVLINWVFLTAFDFNVELLGRNLQATTDGLRIRTRRLGGFTDSGFATGILDQWNEFVFQYDPIEQRFSNYLNGTRRSTLSIDLTNNVYAVDSGTNFRMPGMRSSLPQFYIDESEVWSGSYYDVNSETIPTYGIHHQTGTVTLLNSTAAGKLTAIDAIATGKITKIEHYNDNWSTIASNSAGLTFPLTGIDMVSSGLFRVTLASTDTELQRDTPELISFAANLEPVVSGRKIIQPYRFGPKLIHIGGVI